MARVLFLFCCLLMTAGKAFSAPVASDIPVPNALSVAKALRSTVEISVSGHLTVLNGTGVVIRSTSTEDTIVTACHVITMTDLISVTVTVPGTLKTVEARVIGCMPKMDLATIVVPHQDGMAAAHAALTPASQSTFVIGNPSARAFFISAGSKTLAAQDKLATLCPTCAQGDSGAGLWNVDGDLLGILVDLAQVQGDSRNYELAYPVDAFTTYISLR